MGLEQVLLLAVGDRTGNILVRSEHAALLISSAVFSELVIDKAISVTRINNIVRPGDHQHLQDTLMQDALIKDVVDKVSSARGTYSLTQWIQRIAGQLNLLQTAARQLCDRRILVAKTEQVLWFTSREYYPEINAEPESQIREQIRVAVLKNEPVAPKTAALIGLAAKLILLDQVLSPVELQTHAKRINDIARGDCCVAASNMILASQQAAGMAMSAALMIN